MKQRNITMLYGCLLLVLVTLNMNPAYAQWWDSGWDKCKNITQYNISITGSADWIPTKATITGLTCDNCTKEIRIVNKGCNDGGDVVDTFTYSESGSSPNKEVSIEYLSNYTGDNSTYSIYYDNSVASDNYLNLIKGYETSNYATIEYNGINITKLTKTHFDGYPCGNTGIDSNCNSLNYIRLPNGEWISESFGSARGLGQFLDYNSHYIAPRDNTTLHGIDCGYGGTLCHYKVFADTGNIEIDYFIWEWKFYYRGDNTILIWLNATQNVTSGYTSGAGTGAIEYPSIPFKVAPFNSGSLTDGYWFYADGEDTEDSGDFATTHGATALGDNFHGTYNSSFVAGVINRSGSLYHIVGESLASCYDGDTFKDGQAVSTGLKYQTLYYFFNDSGSWENIKDMGNILDNVLIEEGTEESYEAPTTTTIIPETTTTTVPPCEYLICEGLVSNCMCGTQYVPSPYYCCSYDSSTESLQYYCLIACASVTTTTTPITTTTEPCSEIDMYLHYKLDNTTGDFIYDYSHNDRYATTYNTPEWVDGKINNGLQFNGYSHYFVVANDDYDSFEKTEPFSFSVWVKTNGTEGGFDILTNYNDYVSLSGFSFGTLYGQIGFTLRNNIYEDNYISVLTDDTNINDNVFHHVVVTYDGNSSIDGIKIYVDNELKHIGTEHNTLTGSTLNANPLTSGIAEGSATYGIIDDMRVYNKVLKVRDINYLYNYGYGTEGILGGCIIIPDVMVQKSCINNNTQLLTNTTYFDGDNFYSTLNSTWCEYGCDETLLGTRCNFQPAVEWGIGIVLIFLMVIGIMYLRGVMGW